MQKSIFSVNHKKIGGEADLFYTDKAPVELPKESVESLHYHNRTEIGICRSGNGMWFVKDKTYAISAGDIVFVPAGTPHYSRAVPTKKNPECFCEFIYFDVNRVLKFAGITELLNNENNDCNVPAVLKEHKNAELHFFIKNMIKSVLEMNGNDSSFKMAAHWYSLFVLKLKSNIGESDEAFNVNSELMPALQKIIVDYSEPLTVDILASECSFSACYFITRFKRELGVTPIKYLNNFRIKIASELLAGSNLCIIDICAFVGFSNPSELYRHFHSVYGISPTEYRGKRKIQKQY